MKVKREGGGNMETVIDIYQSRTMRTATNTTVTRLSTDWSTEKSPS